MSAESKEFTVVGGVLIVNGNAGGCDVGFTRAPEDENPS
jgi:hypothetical protein